MDEQQVNEITKDTGKTENEELKETSCPVVPASAQEKANDNERAKETDRDQEEVTGGNNVAEKEATGERAAENDSQNEATKRSNLTFHETQTEMEKHKADEDRTEDVIVSMEEDKQKTELQNAEMQAADIPGEKVQNHSDENTEEEKNLSDEQTAAEEQSAPQTQSIESAKHDAEEQTANTEGNQETDHLLDKPGTSQEDPSEPKAIPLVNHEPHIGNHHEEPQAHDALICNSQKEFLQVPTRKSTKKKKKDVHINLEATISDASKSSTEFSDSDRDHYYYSKQQRMYERTGACDNCRKSRACCIFIYFWVVVFFLCSAIAILVVAFKVLIPYLDAQGFVEAQCEGVNSEYSLLPNHCSCGKSCKSEYPCILVEVTFTDASTKQEVTSHFSDNEASIGAKVSSSRDLKREERMMYVWSLFSKFI